MLFFAPVPFGRSGPGRLARETGESAKLSTASSNRSNDEYAGGHVQ